MKIRFLCLFLILNSYLAYSQILKPAKWSYSMSKNEVKTGATLELIFHVNIDEEWYLYSTDFDPKLDAPHATFTFVPDASYELVGKLRAIGAKEKFDEIWDGKIKYFTKTAEFRQTVKILKSNPVVSGDIDGQVCSNSSGKCVRVNEAFTFNGLKVLAAEIPIDIQPAIIKKNPKEKMIAPKGNPVPDTSKDNKDNYVFSSRLTELEQQKESLIKRNGQGKDETIEYLKAYLRKNGGNKK
jgi:hypothetical protein